MSESKDLSKEMKLFPPEERTLLEENFQKLCGGIKKDKIEKKIVEVSIIYYSFKIIKCNS